ncbi:PREDICTED: 21 kDa protein-like [Nicotiana attenuata]|uniref:21 kDa protein n=1 Tax=Nicotiana attenuata TaxID=49451 RepID=A0A1J6IT65_NICAT|nr:PREDICTED: 21 kDa protein-like [Nicotiana attenuata]OIT03736.1 21 kda protein [Nicotiana attenuata]
MAALKLILLAAVISLFCFSGTANSAPIATSFIKSSCKFTTYPVVCVTSLAGYAPAIKRSPQQLAQTALSVSLDRAQSTQAFINKLCKFKGLKPREYAALKDCVEQMSDTIDRISKSVKELKNMRSARGKDFQWHMSNIETWISAALTDENTCGDGFAGKALNGRIKASIRARVTHVTQVTSNALALINQFAAKH